MGVDDAGRPIAERAVATIDAVDQLFSSIGIPKTIADLGIVEAQLSQVAEQALGSARLIKNNPRPLDMETMSLLVDAAFTGDRSRLQAFSSNRKAI
jgi:alcohol dehydrogenase